MELKVNMETFERPVSSSEFLPFLLQRLLLYSDIRTPEASTIAVPTAVAEGVEACFCRLLPWYAVFGFQGREFVDYILPHAPIWRSTVFVAYLKLHIKPKVSPISHPNGWYLDCTCTILLDAQTMPSKPWMARNNFRQTPNL